MLRMIAAAFTQAGGAKKYTLHHDGAIHLMEARRGRGKSYSATAIMLNALENKIPVITNTSALDFRYIAYYLMKRRVHPTLADAYLWMSQNIRYASHWDDVLQAHDCVVILDECSNIFPSKPSDSTTRTPPIMYAFFQQSRKVNVTVWLLTQELPAVVNRVRVLVDWVWFVRKVQKPNRPPTSFWMYGVDPGGAGRVDTLDRAASIEYKINIPFTIEVARCYRTHEIIRPLEGQPSYNTLADLIEYHHSNGRTYTPDGHAALQICLQEWQQRPALDDYGNVTDANIVGSLN